MPKLATVIKQIFQTECFDIVMLWPDGTKVRSDKEGIHVYNFDRKAKDTYTVSEWKRIRFNSQFAGYECDVLDGDGDPVSGNMTLKKLRSTYRVRRRH
jgi:hypothetical protein